MRQKLEVVQQASGEWALQPFRADVGYDEGFFLAVRAIQIMLQKLNRLVVVGIAGPSGAGKTSMAQRICNVVPGTTVISLDNYMDASRKVIDGNYDDSRLLDFEMLVSNIVDLKQGKETLMPLYDFRKSGRYAYKRLRPPKSNLVIVEGTYALYAVVRPHLDIRISVSGGVHNDLVKRVLRDTHRTGQNPYEALTQITETVYPMYKAFIEPDLKHAHIRIVNSFNPFSALFRPTYMLKSEVPVDEASILKLLPNAQITSDASYDIYLRPNESTPTSGRDWIRVRNSQGQYSVMFSEDITEGDFIVSPRIDFVVSVRILGGLMTMGYKTDAIINRNSRNFRTDEVSVSIDKLEQLGQFVMIRGPNRQKVAEIGRALGLEGTYITRTFIQLYQERYGQAVARARM